MDRLARNCLLSLFDRVESSRELILDRIVETWKRE